MAFYRTPRLDCCKATQSHAAYMSDRHSIDCSLLCAGVVVVAVMVITTILVSIVMLVVWRWHWLAVVATVGFLFTMESVLLSAVLYRVRTSGLFIPAYIRHGRTWQRG